MHSRQHLTIDFATSRTGKANNLSFSAAQLERDDADDKGGGRENVCLWVMVGFVVVMTESAAFF